MRTLAVMLFVIGCAGCGGEKQDNSKIQSPSDQPIGAPKGLNGGKDAPVNLGSGGGKGGAAPKVEIKQ